MNTESTRVGGGGVRSPLRFKLIKENLPLLLFQPKKRDAAEEYLGFFCGNTAYWN